MIWRGFARVHFLHRIFNADARRDGLLFLQTKKKEPAGRESEAYPDARDPSNAHWQAQTLRRRLHTFDPIGRLLPLPFRPLGAPEYLVEFFGNHPIVGIRFAIPTYAVSGIGP